jgi:serine/threonine-protein kinase
MRHEVVAGRYRLDDRLSTTTMADVWLAHDAVLERSVVVKLLAADADRERFEREARAAASLAHPNIVQVFDYGEDEGRPFMVLEYLPGGTLAERLPEAAALDDAETRPVATDVAAGLAHAHSHGVVHRDLKPDNVLFDDEGRAKVSDFGIAYVVGTDTLTEAGTVLGTALSMAPEQVAGAPATAATDVYAFGVLLYRLLSGRFPFESENALQLARMHRDVDPPPLGVFRRDAPADLAALTTAALAKDPAARPPDGAALLRALRSDRRAAPIATAATVRLPAARQRRRRLAYLGAGLVLLAAGIAAAVIAFGTHPSSAPAVSSTRRHTTRHRPTQPLLVTSSSPSSSTPSTTTRPTSTYKPPPPPPSTTLSLPSTTLPTATLPTTTGP